MRTNNTLDALILIRLTYVSRARPDLSKNDFNEILATARTNNTRDGISGMLCFNKQYFLQSIEGSRSVISRLLNILSDDNRHFDVQILACEEIEKRNWSEWSMNYATPTPSNKHIYFKYSTTSNFNPYLLDGESAHQMMLELADVKSLTQKAHAEESEDSF